LFEIENICAGSGNDTLVGNSVSNDIEGGLGNDIVDAGVGNDTLEGGVGNDSLIGGAGNDLFAGGAGNDSLVGGDGIDLANYSTASVALNVNLSNGTSSGDGMDVLSGIENVTTGSANDSLVGNSVDNNLSSGLGNDSLDGGAGNDVVDAGAGNDSLMGGLGNDTLTGCFFGANGGRSEIDTLVGGVGNDIFQLGWSSGRFYDDGNTANAGRTDYILITDFTVGQDKLQLDGAASGYYLAASGVTGVSGTGLYAEQGATDELIAIVRSANSTALNATNTVNTALFV
jgi:Ca2+-binding RTX toxin-like protein